MSKLGGTFALRALNLICHKEIWNNMYQCVQNLSKNTLQTEFKQFFRHEGKSRDEYAVFWKQALKKFTIKTTVLLTSLQEEKKNKKTPT